MFNRVTRSHTAKVLLAGCFLAGSVMAAEPNLKHLRPVAGKQGTSLTVTPVGKVDPWPPRVWVDSPGVRFNPTPMTGVFNVEIAPDAAPGPRLVRFYNQDGASEPRFFIVSKEQDLRETEPNDVFKAPQKLESLPATVDGRMDRGGDVDSFAVTLKKGQTLVARAEAYTLASPFDGMLRIVDTRGALLAFNHDDCTPDPFLTWEVPYDGTFIVQIMGFVLPATNSVNLTGGENCIYRLHLTAGPFVRHTLPLAAQRGKTTPVQLVGWNLSSKNAELDGTAYAPSVTTAALSLPDVAADQPLIVSDLPEAVEKESGDNTPEPITVPGAITGRIEKANDEDRFTFTAVKKRTYDISLTAASVGSSLDAWLKVENKDGKQLARGDDAGGSKDPQLTWTAPSDGTFTIAVGDVTHRGGEDFLYRLAVTEATPSVTATVAEHALKLQPGKTGELKITVKPVNGFTQKLQLAAKNLPEGISATDVEIPAKGGDVTLKIAASADVKAANQPFQLVLRETEGGKEHPVHYPLASTSLNNGVPQGFSDLVIESTEQLWLTVAAETAK